MTSYTATTYRCSGNYCPSRNNGLLVSECATNSEIRQFRELTVAWPDGWWTMMREFGREWRMPGLPAVSSNEAMLAAWPTHHVATGGNTYCIVS